MIDVSAWFIVTWCLVVGLLSGLVGYTMAAGHAPRRRLSQRGGWLHSRRGVQ